MTPAAISRMVHLLEQRLGVTLFERKANRLVPTAGRAAPIRPASRSCSISWPASPSRSPRWAARACSPSASGRPSRSAGSFRGWRISRRRSRTSRCASRPAARRCTVQRRLDLRHPARRRRLAGSRRGAAVRGRPHAGLLARAGAAAEAAGGSEEGNVAARHACGGRLAALVQGRRALGIRRRDRSSTITASAAGRRRRRRRRDRHRPYIDDDLAAGRLVAPFAQSVPKGARWYLVYRAAREAKPRSWRSATGSCEPPPRRKAIAPSARVSPACRAARPCSTCTSP